MLKRAFVLKGEPENMDSTPLRKRCFENKFTIVGHRGPSFMLTRTTKTLKMIRYLILGREQRSSRSVLFLSFFSEYLLNLQSQRVSSNNFILLRFEVAKSY